MLWLLLFIGLAQGSLADSTYKTTKKQPSAAFSFLCNLAKGPTWIGVAERSAAANSVSPTLAKGPTWIGVAERSAAANSVSPTHQKA